MNAEGSRLAAACERALVASARAGRAGTRQQRRAAARRFVRRHRRDAGYLRWVLRSVGASSALALSLLELAAGPAHAKATLFAERTGAANPLAGQDVGTFSTPAAPCDLDRDGDLDLVVGEGAGGFRYFENTGGAESLAFVPRTGASNPLDGLDAGSASAPTLGDVDGDGDLDLVAGEGTGGFVYFENTGSATSPAFALRTGSASPLDGMAAGSSAKPWLADLDRDGDLDLVTGEGDGTFQYYENTGSATSPAFTPRTGPANPLDGQDVGAASAPSLADFDGDGDLDLVAGADSGVFFYFDNTGNAAHPAFAARPGAANPLDGQDVGSASAPAPVDLDHDGDLDLVAGESSGTFLSFENRAGLVLFRSGASNPLDGIDIGYETPDIPAFSAPSLGDLDGDGDLDLVSGEWYGRFFYYENTGSADSPAFVLRTGAASPLDGLDVGLKSMPALADLDHDGDLDLVSGGVYGNFFYYENTGIAASAAFVARTGAANPLNGQSVSGSSAPALADCDWDGDLDLASGSAGGGLLYFENTGSKSSPGFVPRTGSANPLPGLTRIGGPSSGTFSAPALGDLDGDRRPDLVIGSRPGLVVDVDIGDDSTPTLADLDGDGDLDAVAGARAGTFYFFEDTGLKPSLQLFELTGRGNPLYGQDVGLYAKASLGDLDHDGDLDLVAGESEGTFAWFENTGNAIHPLFVRRTGAANPLDGQDVVASSVPALGDLDADGDLDLVASNADRDFLYFENTGSATAPAFIERTGTANPLDPLVPIPETFDLLALGDGDRDGDLDLSASGLVCDYGCFTVIYTFENSGTATSPAFSAGYAPYVVPDPDPGAGDLDGDGDRDLIVGDDAGTFRTFYLPEPGHGVLLGAGLALLSLLERLRCKRRRRER